MSEIKFLSAALLALMFASYVSWHRKDDVVSEDKVSLVDIKADELERLHISTKTQTVSFSFRTDSTGARYPWFEVELRDKTNKFVGNSQTDKFIKMFTPFEALRSLGRELSPEELKATGLDKPERKMTIGYLGKSKSFVLGGRTQGARDHYLKPVGSEEVFLIASQTIGDLQFPEGKYLQRKMRETPITDVEKALISTAGQTVTLLQQNRLSPQDAFWVREDQPEEKSETYGNYINKLEQLSATEYVDDRSAFDQGTPVMDIKWFGENNKNLGEVSVRRTGEGKDANYYAIATVTYGPVRLSRFTAEQAERDLLQVLGGNASSTTK